MVPEGSLPSMVRTVRPSIVYTPSSALRSPSSSMRMLPLPGGTMINPPRPLLPTETETVPSSLPYSMEEGSWTDPPSMRTSVPSRSR